MFDYLANFTDVFFNGRPARHPETGATLRPRSVTIKELIRRKHSVIVLDGKLYDVAVTPRVILAKEKG
jgi:orotidine-5'-phosphate decarboxylase